MPFIPTEAAARVELLQSLDNQNIENVLYFDRDQDYTLAQISSLGNSIIDWWIEEMAPNLSANLSLVGVKVTALHDQTGPQLVMTDGLPTPGLVNANPVPNNSAYCISFRTGFLGRAFRGRNYVPGIAETDVDMSRISGTRSTALVNAYQALLGGFIDGSRWIVVTSTVNGVAQNPKLRSPVLSVQAVDLIMDSQRRRLPGRGT